MEVARDVLMFLPDIERRYPLLYLHKLSFIKWNGISLEIRMVPLAEILVVRNLIKTVLEDL